jgi:hypothetical protein
VRHGEYEFRIAAIVELCLNKAEGFQQKAPHSFSTAAACETAAVQ